MSLGYTFCDLSGKQLVKETMEQLHRFILHFKYFMNVSCRALNTIIGIHKRIQRTVHRVNMKLMGFITKDYLRFVIYLSRYRTREFNVNIKRSKPASLASLLSALSLAFLTRAHKAGST